MAWGNYRYAVQGHCAAKGLGALLMPNFEAPKEGEFLKDYYDRIQKLLGVLLQTTRDLAGLVVRPYCDVGDGVGAWKALIQRYGNDSGELRRGHDKLSTRDCLIVQNARIRTKY